MMYRPFHHGPYSSAGNSSRINMFSSMHGRGRTSMMPHPYDGPYHHQIPPSSYDYELEEHHRHMSRLPSPYESSYDQAPSYTMSMHESINMMALNRLAEDYEMYPPPRSHLAASFYGGPKKGMIPYDGPSPHRDDVGYHNPNAVSPMAQFGTEVSRHELSLGHKHSCNSPATVSTANSGEEGAKNASAMLLLANASGVVRKEEHEKENTSDWNAMYQRLVRFKDLNGHTRAPRTSYDKLGEWVDQQRYQKNLLTPQQIQKLDAIGMVWKVKDTWQAMFERLKDYKKRFGNCLVPQHYTADPKLGGWVQEQRRNKKQNVLPEERETQLEALGFIWCVKRMATWQVMFEKLVDYHKKHGDCLVPTRWPDDPQLGMWVNNQRRRRQALSAERRQKLDSIGFVWSMYQKESWDVMFDRLVEYKAKNGDCRVPQYYKENPKLGRWVDNQRFRKEHLSEERKLRLESIGFVWRIHR